MKRDHAHYMFNNVARQIHRTDHCKIFRIIKFIWSVSTTATTQKNYTSSHWCINCVGSEFTCCWSQYDLLIEMDRLLFDHHCVSVSHLLLPLMTQYIHYHTGTSWLPVIILIYQIITAITVCVWRCPHLDPASSSSGSILRAWRTLML